MLNRYIDLINSPTKENIQYDESSSGTTIDTSMESDSDSQSDFYSTFITKYRKTIKHLMSSSQLDEDSFQLDTESHLSESSDYDSYKSSFLYSKPLKNQSYQSPKSKIKHNQENHLYRTISPSTHKQKTRINFSKNKVSTNYQSKKTYDKNRSPSPSPLPVPKKSHHRKHSQRKRRRKMEDFLSFDPVFNKYFYFKDKIESSEDHQYSDYSYYDDDGYNDQENDDNQIQNNSDTISDIIDSNSVAHNESSDYDDSLQWVETGKVVSRKPHKNHAKVDIWEPNLSTPTLKKLNGESRIQKLHH